MRSKCVSVLGLKETCGGFGYTGKKCDNCPKEAPASCADCQSMEKKCARKHGGACKKHLFHFGSGECLTPCTVPETCGDCTGDALKGHCKRQNIKKCKALGWKNPKKGCV